MKHARNSYRRGLACGACAGLLLVLPAPAAAESASRGLAEAEQAFQNVDFTKAHEQAARALEAGAATREETARLYVLVGTSAAALGNEEEAKRAFTVALAVDPTLKLEQTLSPKLRAPYLEALGFWGSYSERLAVEARVSPERDRVAVRLTDPAHLAVKVALHTRTVGSDRDRVDIADANRSSIFVVPVDARRRGFDYFVQVLDAHGNVLAELGSETDPREARLRVNVAPTTATESDSGRARDRSYLLPVTLAAAGAVAIGVGVVFHVKRENDAQEWNGPGCERPGVSRGEQCGDLESRVRLDQGLAIGGYAVGGALLTGSVITLLFGRGHSGPERESGRTGVSGCTALGSGVWCSGRF